MGLTYIGVVGGAAGKGTNITISGSVLSSAGAVSGDILIFMAFTYSRGVGATTSASFMTNIDSDPLSENRRSSLYWGVWDGTSAVTFAGTTNASDAMAVVGQVWRRGGDDGSSPIGSFAKTSGWSTNPDPNPVTPDIDDCAVVVMAGSSSNDATPGTMAGYTTVQGYGATDTNPASAHSAYNILSGQSRMSQDPPSWSSWSSGYWHAYSLILRPGPSLLAARKPIIVSRQAVMRASNW